MVGLKYIVLKAIHSQLLQDLCKNHQIGNKDTPESEKRKLFDCNSNTLVENGIVGP